MKIYVKSTTIEDASAPKNVSIERGVGGQAGSSGQAGQTTTSSYDPAAANPAQNVGQTAVLGELLPYASGIAHRDGALDDHRGRRVDLQHLADHILHGRGVEEILRAVIVRRGGDDHKLGIRIAGLPVQRGAELQRLVRQIILYVLVLNGRLPVVDHLHALGHDVHGGDIVTLRQQSGNTQTNIAGSCYGNIHIIAIFIKP